MLRRNQIKFQSLIFDSSLLGVFRKTETETSLSNAGTELVKLFIKSHHLIREQGMLMSGRSDGSTNLINFIGTKTSHYADAFSSELHT